MAQATGGGSSIGGGALGGGSGWSDTYDERDPNLKLPSGDEAGRGSSSWANNPSNLRLTYQTAMVEGSLERAVLALVGLGYSPEYAGQVVVQERNRISTLELSDPASLNPASIAMPPLSPQEAAAFEAETGTAGVVEDGESEDDAILRRMQEVLGTVEGEDKHPMEELLEEFALKGMDRQYTDVQKFMESLDPNDPEFDEKVQDYLDGNYPSVGIPAQTETIKYLRGRTRQASPNGQLYPTNAEIDNFIAMSPERIAETNLMLMDAGLLDPDYDLNFGWSVESRAAMSVVLAHANDIARAEGLPGLMWQTALHDLSLANQRGLLPNEFTWDGAGGQVAEEPVFVRDVYRPPDYKTLSRDVKEYAKERLGRDFKPYELPLLTDAFMANDRAAYELDQEANEAIFNAEVGNHALAVDSIATIDPSARLQEQFDKLYAPEMNHMENVANVGTNMGTLLAGITGIDRKINSG